MRTKHTGGVAGAEIHVSPAHKPTHNRRYLAILTGGAVIVVAVVLVFLFRGQLFGSRVVFEVAGVNYSQKTVRQLAAYQTDVERKTYPSAARAVYDQVRYQAAAKSLGLHPKSEQIALYQVNVDKATYQKYRQWFDLLAYNQAAQHSLAAAKGQTVLQGYSFVFWFGNAVQPFYHDPSPEYGDQQAYRRDMQYARNKADFYRQQLNGHSMTADQVLKAVSSDPKLADLNDTTLPLSVRFGYDPAAEWRAQVQLSQVATYVQSLSKPGLSSIQTGTVGSKPGPNPPQQLPAYYYFIQLDNTHAPDGSQQFKQALAKLNAKYFGA